MIDVHAHYVPPSLLQAAAGRVRPIAYDPDSRVLDFPSGPSRPVPPILTNLDKRLDWMREQSIERQVLSPWMDIAGDDLKAADAAAWCRMSNDTMAEDLLAIDAFSAFALLPMANAADAADELVRAVTELGFVGAAIPTQVDGIDLDEAGLDPLFDAAETLGVPLFVHPSRVMAEKRMSSYFMANVCGNPFETTLAAMRLYFGGVLDTWPQIKILLAHAGGVLPTLAGRASHASLYAPGFNRQMRSPDTILDRFYYDTLLHDRRALSFVLETIGPMQIAAGTDAPFPMRLENPTAHIESACEDAGLDESDCQRVLQGTAIELLGA